MTSKQSEIHKDSNNPTEQSSVTVGWTGRISEQFQKIKEHAETYPYVWASYAVVYGTLGFWLTYRWRKLRKTEDNVRVLQERLRKLVEAEESSASATTTSAEQAVNSNESPSSSEKSTK